MSISVRCGSCGKSYQLKDAAAGRQFSCKECGKPVRVPRRKKTPQPPIEDDDGFDAALDESDSFSTSMSQRDSKRSSGKRSNPREKAKRLATWGQRLLGAFFVVLILGNIIVRRFVPPDAEELSFAGKLMLIIPIYSTGLAGLVLSLTAWIMCPDLSEKLELNFPKRPDGRYFGDLTRTLGCLLISLICLGVAVGVFSSKVTSPLVFRLLGLYVAVCSWAFIVYLSNFFSPSRQRATTTYINLLTPFFAFLLIPISWPILIWLSLKGNQGKQSKKRRR
jgi:hypothetical protein